MKVIFRDADVHGNVFPALEKSLDRTSVTFVLSAVGPVEYSTCQFQVEFTGV